jgi:DNA polymerase-1
MNRLLLVDGHNLLCKAFYGVPEKILANGRPVQGVIGFISITVKIIRDMEPTHILVVFDPEEQPSRAKLYSPYKQNRQDFGNKPDRENPFSQLMDIKRTLDSLGIKYTEKPGYEADDLIASFATRSNGEAVIVSSDTDFLQLVGKRISMFRYHGKKSVLFNEMMVQRRYGIHPSRFLEYKALIGDKTDNIDGIRGVGPKTAIKILNGMRELTAEEQKIFERNLRLIKLDTEVDLPYDMHELSCNNKFEEFKAGKVLRSIGVL